MSSIIQFRQVTKRFGRQLALDDVSFHVPRGVVFALLGENGAGKTTAIRIMLGLANADDGQVLTLDRDSRLDGQAIRRRVGYVAERPSLYEWMTVDEIGWFTAGFYEDGFWERYQALVRQQGLVATKRLKNLSKGMRAKVALALSLAHDPELLVLDEPTSGLDPLVRREFLESMVERAATGKTVFLSSHQIHEVERVADVVGILRGGKLMMLERLDELKREIRELTVTLINGAPQPPDLPGEILRRQHRQRQWQLMARNVNDDAVTRLRADRSVGAVEVRTPSLEEIFVAVMRGSGDELPPSKPEPNHE